MKLKNIETMLFILQYDIALSLITLEAINEIHFFKYIYMLDFYGHLFWYKLKNSWLVSSGSQWMANQTALWELTHSSSRTGAGLMSFMQKYSCESLHTNTNFMPVDNGEEFMANLGQTLVTANYRALSKISNSFMECN